MLLERIREAIGEDEMEERRLRVGDAYTFQGDERDVVLVSMVVSANDGRVAAFTKREYHRRINVAASRARDQLWIFHSVQPSHLLADDARALLLSYALDDRKAYDDRAALSESTSSGTCCSGWWTGVTGRSRSSGSARTGSTSC